MTRQVVFSDAICKTLAFFIQKHSLDRHQNRSRQRPGPTGRESRLGHRGGTGAAQPGLHGGVHGLGLLPDARHRARPAGQARQVTQGNLGRLCEPPSQNRTSSR